MAQQRSYRDRYVKVTCRLASPMAGLDAPYLDSLCELVLAHRAKSIMETSGGHRHRYTIQPRGQEIDVSAVGKLPIPIVRRTVDELPVPRCSSPIVGNVMSDHATHYTSAFPLDKAERLSEKERTKIMQSGGRFKSFRLPLRMRLTPCVVWFAALNDQPSTLKKLLRKIRHLGKKASQGHGVVAEWIVEPIEDDWSWYADSPDGPVLMRPLPADMDHPDGLSGFRQSFGGCVGPYWQRDFWREILEPC